MRPEATSDAEMLSLPPKSLFRYYYVLYYTCT
jgi:hypothetical protein